MPATLTVGHLAWRRLRRDWAAYVPTSLGLGVALGLATAVILTQALTEEASLRSHLAHLGASSLVEVRHSQALDQGGYEEFKRETERVSRDDMGGLVRPAGYRLLSGGNLPISRNGVRTAQLPRGDPRAGVVRLAAYEGIEHHADLLSGRWPEPVQAGPWPAGISESTARATGLAVGDTECVSGLDLRAQPACFAITGVFRPHAAAEPFWGSDLFPPIAYVLPVGSYFAILAGQHGQLSDAVAVLVPDLAGIRTGNLDQVLDRLRRLRGFFSVRLAYTTIVTQLDQDLDGYVHRSQVASFAVQLVAAQLLLVAFYCAGFLAWRLLQQQRAQIAVWRTRGWKWTSIALLLALEMSIVAAAALPVGLGAGGLAAAAVSHLAYGRDLLNAGLEPGRLWMPLAAAFGGALVLVWAMAAWTAARGGLRQRQIASRPPRPWWRRWNLDLVLAGVSLPLLAQAQLLGSAQVRESGGAPPYSVLLPALALAFIALAGLRLLPIFAGAAAYLSRGVESRLAGVQLGRAPAQHAGLGLLLALTVGVGVFASTFATTSAQSASDRAAFSAGADVRAVFGGFLPHEFENLQLPGAAVQSPVFSSYARPGASNTEVPLVAVEPYTFKQVAWSRPDLFPRPLAAQLQTLAEKEPGGLVLPEGASKLSLWVFGANTGGRLVVRLGAADGRPVRADFGALDFDGWRQLEAELAPGPAALHQPLRLREIAFTPVSRTGTLALSHLTAAGPSLPSPVLLEGFAGAEVSTPSGPRIMGSPWWQSDPETGIRLGGLLPSTRIPRDGARTIPIYLEPGWRFAHLTPFRPEPRGPNFNPYLGPGIPPVTPALASPSVLRRLGLKVGDRIQLQLDNVPLPVRVEGTIDYFPTVYSRQGDFFVVSLEPSLAAIGMFGHRRPWPDQLWVKAQPGQVGGVVAALRSTPDVVDVFDRGRLEADARAAPLRVSLAANLGLGFAAMLLLALLGFAIHFGLVARSRASDYAILEANGMDPGQIRRSLALEQAVLLAFSLFAGYGLGLLLALAILPNLQVGAELTETVPPPLVRADPALVGGALALVTVLTLAVGRLIGRAGSRVDLVGELRALG